MRGALLACLLAVSPAALADAPRYEAPAPGSYELPPILQVAEYELLGVDGTPSPLLALAADEVAIVSFVYLSCADGCPLSTALLHRLDRELAEAADLKERVQLVTVSFDPERDTPESMSALAGHLAPRSRWRFLTAPDAEAIAAVLADFGQDAVWIPTGDVPAPERLRHVLKVFLVDAKGAVRNIYSTGMLDSRLVLADLRTVLGLAE